MTPESALAHRRQQREDFEALAFEHLSALRAFAYRLTQGGPDYEDLVQDTYLLAYRSQHRFRPGTNMKAWLFRIMKNSFISSCRKRNVRPAELSSDGVEGGYESLLKDTGLLDAQNPEAALAGILVAEDIEAGLQLMAEPYRMVVVACLLEGLSYKEAAMALDIPEGTVMSRLHRGRQALQSHLLRHAAQTRDLSGTTRRLGHEQGEIRT